jgi:DNA-binding NarL/FixJ family response regulator
MTDEGSTHYASFRGILGFSRCVSEQPRSAAHWKSRVRLARVPDCARASRWHGISEVFREETIMEPSTTPIRVLIADDHEVVRQGLRVSLGVDPELEVVGEAADGAEAVHLAHRLRPDVVLMDLLMPQLDGIAATEIIRRELPDTEVVALTSVLEDLSVVGAVRAGAIGYLLKDTRAPELRRAIKAAAAGQVQLSPSAAARLMREVKAPERPEALSERELEVLRLLARGRANKEISRDLGIAEKTVKTHVSSILGKLGVQSRTQAALYAGRVGVVPVDQLGTTDPDRD